MVEPGVAAPADVDALLIEIVETTGAGGFSALVLDHTLFFGCEGIEIAGHGRVLGFGGCHDSEIEQLRAAECKCQEQGGRKQDDISHLRA